MTGGGQEQVLGLLKLLGGGHVTEVDDLLIPPVQPGAQDFQPAAVLQPVGQLGAGLRRRERQRPARRVLGGDSGQPVRGRVPLADEAVAVKHRYAVRAGVDHRPLVCALLDHLLEGRHVGQRYAGVPGQQLEQLKLDVTDLAPAVQGVQRAVGPPGHVRQAERDRVQAG